MIPEVVAELKKENKVLGCVSILVAIDQELNTRTSWLKHPSIWNQ